MVKTIIISITFIICTVILSYTLLSISNSNNYMIFNNEANWKNPNRILDTQSGTIYLQSGDYWETYIEFNN